MQPLLEVARTFSRTAREEIERGFEANNYVKVRDGAEKAWNAVVQATDRIMQCGRGDARPFRVETRTGIGGNSSRRSVGAISPEISRTLRSASTGTSSTWGPR